MIQQAQFKYPIRQFLLKFIFSENYKWGKWFINHRNWIGIKKLYTLWRYAFNVKQMK